MLQWQHAEYHYLPCEEKNVNVSVLIPLSIDVDAVVGTCSAVAELFPGDQVRVTGDEEFSGTARGDGFSGFTGYLIKRLD